MNEQKYWASLTEEEREGWMDQAKEEIKEEKKELKSLGYGPGSAEWDELSPERLSMEIAFAESPQEKEAHRKYVEQKSKKHNEARLNEMKLDHDAFKRGFGRFNGVEYPLNECSPGQIRILQRIHDEYERRVN